MIGWLHHWIYEDIWVPSFGNVLAMPLCGIAASTVSWIFRDRLGRRVVQFWIRHHRAELERQRAAEDAK